MADIRGQRVCGILSTMEIKYYSESSNQQCCRIPHKSITPVECFALPILFIPNLLTRVYIWSPSMIGCLVPCSFLLRQLRHSLEVHYMAESMWTSNHHTYISLLDILFQNQCYYYRAAPLPLQLLQPSFLGHLSIRLWHVSGGMYAYSAKRASLR